MTIQKRDQVSRRAYALWEESGRSHGHDIEHWLKAESEINSPLLVTFDSNTYRRVTDPTFFPKDPQNGNFIKINNAIKDGRIKGYLSETIITLEGIQNTQRGMYFSSFGGGAAVLHPGLHQMVEEWLNRAIALGFEFLRTPRIGVPRPPFSDNIPIKSERDDKESSARQDLYFQVGRDIVSNDVGFKIINDIGDDINKRNKTKAPWFMALNQAQTPQEHKKIQKAVGEWADGDTIAAHVGYKIDILCSEDRAVGAGKSVFDQSNRVFFKSKYNINIMSIADLAAIL